MIKHFILLIIVNHCTLSNYLIQSSFFEFNDLYHEHVSYGTLNDSKGNPFKTREGGTKNLLVNYLMKLITI